MTDGAVITARFVGGTLSGSIDGAAYRAAYDWDHRTGRLDIAALPAGEGASALERDYRRLLGAVASARGESGGRLALSDGRGEGVLWFVAGATVAPEVVGRWAVAEVHRGDDRRPGPSAGGPTAHLTFESDGLVTGSAGVNRVRGQARTDGDALYLGPLVTTRMSGDAEAMDAERELLAALERVARFHVGGDGLTLLDGDGEPCVRLRRAPDGN